VPNWSAISNSPSGTTSASSDTTAPGTTANLATSSPTSSSITLTWTAPGDDGTTGTATTYDIRYRTGGAVVTTNWTSATQCTGEPTPHVAGTGESFVVSGLTASTTYYFGLKTADEVPNWSAVSNSPSGTTSAGGGGNLLTNPGFETGDYSGWSWNGNSTGASIATNDKHGGTYSSKFDANVGVPDLNQVFSTTNGQQYTVTAWLRITSETGSDWGGFRVQVSDYSTWTTLGSVQNMLQGTYGSNWYQISFNFTASSTQSRIHIGQFSGTGLKQVVYADDVQVSAVGG
jgi:hypothetical protein